MDFKISMAAARVNAGKSQQDVADEMGLARTTIVLWEKGKVIPKAAQFEMFCRVCNIPKDYVFLPNH